MPGPGARIVIACRCFFALLFKGILPEDVLDRFRPLSPAPTPEVAITRDDTGERAVQLLGILQRDGRFVDFLQEDLTAYSDAQIGSAVRDVHGNCRAALVRYVTLEPVLGEAEGDRIRVGAVDPVRLKLVGAVSAKGVPEGIVRHRGWRVTHVALPPLAAEDARAIVAPAEVEVI